MISITGDWFRIYLPLFTLLGLAFGTVVLAHAFLMPNEASLQLEEGLKMSDSLSVTLNP